MYETNEDLTQLQSTLDASYQRAGSHLRSVVTPERLLDANGLIEILTRVCLLNLATINQNGEPRVAPVDGLFYRGQFWFGTSPRAVRVRHIQQRPKVSASHVRGESLGVIVHGEALIVGPADGRWASFREYLNEVYGRSWDEWGTDATYARINASWLYAFSFADLENGHEGG